MRGIRRMMTSLSSSAWTSARAYSINALIGVEVPNDHFGDDYVAVAY